MLQISFYRIVSFITTSKVRIQNDTDMSVNLCPHIQTLPTNQDLLHEGFNLALPNKKIFSTTSLSSVVLSPAQANSETLSCNTNEESLCSTQSNGLTQCLNTVCAADRRTLHDSASSKPILHYETMPRPTQQRVLGILKKLELIYSQFVQPRKCTNAY